MGTAGSDGTVGSDRVTKQAWKFIFSDRSHDFYKGSDGRVAKRDKNTKEVLIVQPWHRVDMELIRKYS